MISKSESTSPMPERVPIAGSRSEVFDARFYRSLRMLYFIARRVLCSDVGLEEAVQNTWFKASRNPPDFEYEGEFRGWLLRILIDEALAVRSRIEEDQKPH